MTWGDIVIYFIYAIVLVVIVPIWLGYTTRIMTQSWYKSKREHVKHVIAEGTFNGQEDS